MDYNYSRDMSQESHNRRKRPYNGNDSRGRDAKRSNRNTKPTLKVLLPTHAAGKLIGKGGKTVSELQKKYSASIDVAPSDEYFPGTECRPVNLSAEIEQIVELVIYIIDEVHDERDNNTDFTMVITDFAIGYIMGRGGSVIKTIQDDSGANIRIQKQNDAPSPGERTVTISGTTDEKRAAALTMIDKMSAEPLRISKPHFKYDSYSSRDDSYSSKYDSYPTKYSSSDPFRDCFNLSSNQRAGETDRYPEIIQDKPAHGYGGAGMDRGGLGMGLGAAAALGGIDQADTYEARRKAKTTFSMEMRDDSYSSKYDSFPTKYSSSDPFQSNYDDHRDRFNLSSNQRSGETGRYPAIVQDELARGYGGAGMGHGGLGMGLGASVAATAAAALGGIDQADTYKARCKAKTTFSVEMQIPNAMVGSIVGKSGAQIKDMSRSSGAQISFSGKGEFVPGTQDRILTIKGSKKQVQKAHMMIDSKVLEVEYAGI